MDMNNKSFNLDNTNYLGRNIQIGSNKNQMKIGKPIVNFM